MLLTVLLGMGILNKMHRGSGQNRYMSCKVRIQGGGLRVRGALCQRPVGSAPGPGVCMRVRRFITY
jgi:hypothetical protein